MLIAMASTFHGVAVVGFAGRVTNHVIRVDTQRVVTAMPGDAVALQTHTFERLIANTMHSFATDLSLVGAALDANVDRTLVLSLACSPAGPDPTRCVEWSRHHDAVGE